MSYLRYHRILLIGITVEKCVKENQKLFLRHALTLSPVKVTMFHHTGNCDQINIENCTKSPKNKKRKKKKSPGHMNNSSSKELTIASAVIIHLGLDMPGNVSIDSHLMMDCVLK